MKELTFTLTVDETNKVLTALGKMPFDQVFQVISKLQMAAGEQMKEEKKDEPKN